MSGQSVLPPSHGEKSPINKKLLIIVLLIALGAVLIMGFIFSAAQTTLNEEDDVNPKKELNIGNPNSIESEWQQQRERRIQLERLKEYAPNNDNENLGQKNEVNKFDIRSGLVAQQIKEEELDPEEELRKIIAQSRAAGAIAQMSVFDEGEGIIQKVSHQSEQKDTYKDLINSLQPQRISESEALAKAFEQSRSLQGNVSTAQLDQGIAGKTEKFMNGLSRNERKILRPEPPAGKWIITAGKVIPTVTTRAQNSDLPCAIQAVVSVDVYDSIYSKRVLIPKGSEVIGVCSNDIAYGQDRILSVFNRLILPDGRSIDLSNGVGMDRLGATGAVGEVNNHFFKMFATSFLIAWGADAVERNRQTPVNPLLGNTGGAQTAAGEVLVDVAEHVLGRHKQVQPTIYVKEGTRMNIQVAHDMVFD